MDEMHIWEKLRQKPEVSPDEELSSEVETTINKCA